MDGEAQSTGSEAEAVAVGTGASLGEAKFVAMKLLQARFPGITQDSVVFSLVRDSDEDGTAEVRGEADLEAWRAVAADPPEDPAERLRALLTRVVGELGLDGTVDISDTDDELRVTVNGDDLGLLIGKHGSTIDAIQHLALRIVGRDIGDRTLVVDAAGYRERRASALQRSADRAVADALRYGRPVELEPMRAGERKVVHLYLRERTDVETHSEGDEPDRRLVVSPLRPSGS